MTPPFGRDIFTAQLIFRRPHLEIIGLALPFLLIRATITPIVLPEIALFLPKLALGGDLRAKAFNYARDDMAAIIICL